MFNYQYIIEYKYNKTETKIDNADIIVPSHPTGRHRVQIMYLIKDTRLKV